jgi:hypothetical protein
MPKTITISINHNALWIVLDLLSMKIRQKYHDINPSK